LAVSEDQGVGGGSRGWVPGVACRSHRNATKTNTKCWNKNSKKQGWMKNENIQRKQKRSYLPSIIQSCGNVRVSVLIFVVLLRSRGVRVVVDVSVFSAPCAPPSCNCKELLQTKYTTIREFVSIINVQISMILIIYCSIFFSQNVIYRLGDDDYFDHMEND
jgi:hypothetical protein